MVLYSPKRQGGEARGEGGERHGEKAPPGDERLSRRSFLSLTSGTVAAMCAAMAWNSRHAVTDAMRAPQTCRESSGESPPDLVYRRVRSPRANVAVFEGEHGRNTLIYTNHLLPVDTSQIPADAHGIALDTAVGDEECLPDMPGVPPEPYTGHPEIYLDTRHYRPLKAFAQKNGAAIISIDFPVRGMTSAILKDGGMMLGEMGIGGLLMNDAMRSRTWGTRRKCLTVLGGAYLCSPFVASVGRNISAATGAVGGCSEAFSQASGAVHPELGAEIDHVRNAVVSVKVRRLIEHMHALGVERPHIVSLFGANHVSYAGFMQKPVGAAMDYLSSRQSLIRHSRWPHELYVTRAHAYRDGNACRVLDTSDPILADLLDEEFLQKYYVQRSHCDLGDLART